VEGETGPQNLDPGGLEVFATDQAAFAKVLKSANHTLKRALTDPRLFSGIGNAYSDEILWAAQLSPVKLTQKLTDEEIKRLFDSTRLTLIDWTVALRSGMSVPPGSHNRGSSPTVREGAGYGIGSGRDLDQNSPIPFPEKVTAFRPGMAVHGKYGQPCRRCGNKIQRIRYAANETNYCPSCQTGGKLLADRALSRLLRADWPKNLDELEGLTSR
jgi:formamidopyrimidine-DNA glycosylase